MMVTAPGTGVGVGVGGRGLTGLVLGLFTGVGDAVGEGLPGRSGLVRVFDALSGSQTAFFQDHKDVILTLAFSPNGALLAAAEKELTP